MGVVLEVRNISSVEVGTDATSGEACGERCRGWERGIWSDACLIGIRAQPLAWLGQGDAMSATGQWVAWGWPTCQPSAVGQPHQRLHPLPLSRWPHSCPACHSPIQSAPPGLSGEGEKGKRHKARCGGHAKDIPCDQAMQGRCHRSLGQGGVATGKDKEVPGVFVPLKSKFFLPSFFFCFRQGLTM